jgi:hypothetical protein
MRQDNGITLALQALDGVDIGGKGGPFDRGDDAADAAIEGGLRR